MGRNEHALRMLTLALVLTAVFGVGQGPAVERLTVTGTVVNSYAITHVEEVLVNQNDYKLDAAFMFKVPDGAFVSNLTLLVDGVLHVADVIPKDEAREKFDAAVSAGRDAGLMEQAGKDVFSYAVSFSPGQTIVVGLTYEMYLSRVLDKYEFPLEINPGGDQHIKDLVVDITVSSYKDIAGLSVPTHPDIDIAYPGADTAKLHFERKDLSTAEKMLVTYSTAATSKAGFLLDHAVDGKRYFFHVFSPIVDEYGEPLDKDIVFVLDKSGSMDESACGGDRKIEQMNDAFASIVGQLREGDRFNVIEFDSDVRVLWDGLRTADQVNRDEAIARIRSIQANGGTDINEGLERALAMLKVDEARVPIVVMLTDGKPSSGTTNTFSIRKNIQKVNTADVSIFSLGLGDNLDFPFLKALSMENYGHAVRIYSCKDVSEQIAEFYKTIDTPILKDLKFEYGDGVVDVFPTAVQRLFAGSEIVLAGRYVGDGDELTVQVSGRSHQGSVTFTETLRFTGGRTNGFIPRFWAFMSIQELLERIEVWGENEEIVGDIVNTSVQYHFVTPYTSLFLEIEKPMETVTVDDDELAEEEATALTGGSTGSGAVPAPTMAPAATPMPPPAPVSPPTDTVYAVRKDKAVPRGAVAPQEAPSSGGGIMDSIGGMFGGVQAESDSAMRERVLTSTKGEGRAVPQSIGHIGLAEGRASSSTLPTLIVLAAIVVLVGLALRSGSGGEVVEEKAASKEEKDEPPKKDKSAQDDDEETDDKDVDEEEDDKKE